MVILFCWHLDLRYLWDSNLPTVQVTHLRVPDPRHQSAHRPKTDCARMTSSKSTNTNDCYSNHIKNTKPSNLNLAIINCRSVCNKQAELNVFLALQNIDIFIGTESHLDNSILNSEVFPNTYNTYRCDRNRHGGGVFILIRKTIPSSELYTTNSDIEIVWAHIHQKSKQDVILGSFYCPPGSSISVLEELQASVSQIKQSFPTAKIILGGDFNAPGPQSQVSVGQQSSNSSSNSSSSS